LISFNLKEQTFIEGNDLFMEGEKCNKITFIIEGKVHLFKENTGKEFQNIDTLYKDDFMN